MYFKDPTNNKLYNSKQVIELFHSQSEVNCLQQFKKRFSVVTTFNILSADGTPFPGAAKNIEDKIIVTEVKNDDPKTA